jgi:iron complex outermembrane receptor protein
MMMFKASLLMSAAMFAIATPSYAQDAQTTDADPMVEAQSGGDIVVTATRRSEALSDVPLAISAVTADSLQNSGASDIRQLNQLSPSLLVSSSSTEAGAGSARIRGIGTVGDNAGLESSVATFIDGVYRSRSGVALTELGPIERIEVLRGPQGTLFGRNASAGLIHVISAPPKFDFGAYAELTYGNYDYWRGQAGITGPLGDTVAFRLDGTYAKRDGFITDANTGRDLNNRDRWLLRGQLLFEPTDALSVKIIGDYAKRDEECCAGVYLESTDPTAIALRSLLDGLAVASGLEPIQNEPYDRRTAITPGRSYRSDVRDWGVSGQVDYDFGNASLTSITAYRDWKWVRGQDADFNSLDIFARPDDGSSNQRFETFTQELRLQGEAFDGKLDWLVGGYYANETLTLNDNLGYGAQYGLFQTCQAALLLAPSTGFAPSPTSPGCLNPTLAGALNAGVTSFGPLGPVLTAALGRLGSLNSVSGLQPSDSYEQKSRNFAVFTHNVFDITDQLSLTLGVRYTNERKRLNADLNANATAAGICAAQSAALTPVLANPLLPASARTLLTQAVGLTCLLPPVDGQFTDTKKEDEFTGTAVLSFKPSPELLTYASYSRGYKAGGYNLDRQGVQLGATSIAGLRFEPETVNAFEVGAKYNGPGFDLNVAGFYQAFDSFQLNTFNGLAFIVENIEGCSELDGGDGSDSDASSTTGACTGKSKSGVTSKGFEIEAFIRPAPYFSTNIGFTYADTRYRDNLTGIDGRPLTAPLFQLPGRRISNSSQYVVTGAVSWTPPLGDGGLSGLAYVDFRYQSDLNTGSDLDLEKVQEGVMVVNARLGVRGNDDRWALEFWAQNVFDVNYKQVGFDAPLQGSGTRRGIQQGFYPAASGLYGAFLAEPRTYGVTVRTKF